MAKIAVSEDFALAVIFFALAVSRSASTFRQLTRFQPQITDFKPRKMPLADTDAERKS